MSETTSSIREARSTLFERSTEAFYNLVRRTPFLNHLAHRVVQSEAIQHIPPYRALYNTMLRRKAARYMTSPPSIEFEITNACNARCIMCPPEVHTGRTIMDHELFKRVCVEAQECGISKMIITGGEPLVDMRLSEKIRWAKAHGFEYIRMFSNGSMLNEKRARELIASGLDSITFSIDSADKETYEAIRVNLKWDRVIPRVKRFTELKKEMGSATPLTHVNMVALKENEGQRQAFREFFGSFIDIVEIIDSHNFAGSQPGLDNPEGHAYSQTTRYPCHLLFSKFVVHAEGHVKKCSIDSGPASVVGDLNAQSLRDVLEGARICGIKRQHLGGDYSEPGCDICTHKESWWTRR